MNIDTELNKLVQKYSISDSNSHMNMIKFIEKILSKYSKFDRIGIRCAGTVTLDLLKNFSNKIKLTAIFDKNPEAVNPELKRYNIPIVSVLEIDKYNLDAIIIGTTVYRTEIKEELKSSNIKNIIDLNEELENLCNVKILENPMKISNNPYIYIIAATSLYRKSKNVDEKIELIKDVITSHINNRDILSTEIWIKEYVKQGYPNKENYLAFLDELKELVNLIKNKLFQRKFKDVIVLWQDGLTYNEVEYMPFESNCRENGLYLKNAYSVVPWTRATLKSVLDEQLIIDDYYDGVADKGHKLTQLFKNNGYDCRYIGTNQCTDLHTFDLEKHRNKLGDFEAITNVNWKLLKVLLLSDDKPVMILAHSIYETHLPNCTPNLENYDSTWWYLPVCEESEYNLWKKQAMIAAKYVDNQTEWLLNLLNNNSVKVLMSDHGKCLHKDSRAWDSNALHINFIVLGNRIKKQICQKMFSLLNFYEMCQYILEPNEDNFNNIFSDEVHHQNCAIFNPTLIKALILHDIEEQGIAYRGLESLNDRYILMETGKEIYNRLPDEKTNYIDDERFKERIKYLRQKTGNKFIDINKDSTFEHSHLLYDSLRKKGRI